MKYPLVLFDLDGTLVDSFADIVAGIRVACAAIDVPVTADLERLATRGIPLEDFYRAMCGEEPGGARFVRFVDAYRACYLPGCLTTTVPFPGVRDVLAALRGRAKVGVATTKRTDTARRVLEGTGLMDLVDVVSGSDGLAHKPDPAVLRKVAGLAGVPVEESIMIGDTDRDVGAARAAGCAACGVTWGGFSEEEMRSLAPDFVVRRPSELIAVLGGD